MKKKLLVTLFAFLLLISVGCGKKEEKKEENTGKTDTEVIDEDVNESGENEGKNGEKEVTNLDVLRRISNLEKIVYGKEKED